MKVKRKRIGLFRSLNVGRVLELFAYLFMAGMLFFLLITKEYKAYIVPRLAPFLWGMIVVLVFMACYTITRLRTSEYKGAYSRAFLLIIPAFMLLYPPYNMNIYADDAYSEITVKQEGADDFNIDTSNMPLDGIDDSRKLIVLNNDNYYMTLLKIGSNLDKYKGYTFISTGYVTRDPSYLTSGDFMVVRMVMACCIADIAPMGIICYGDAGRDLKEGEWVTVKGRIIMGDYHGMPQPALQVEKIKSAKPISGYIYP